jgi:hypothetical protein
MGVLMIFTLFFTLTQTKKKLKSTLIEKIVRTILVIKKYQLYLLSLSCSIAEINYEIFSIRPKAYSYLISVQHYYF